jgi:hypothetical protein
MPVMRWRTSGLPSARGAQITWLTSALARELAADVAENSVIPAAHSCRP